MKRPGPESGRESPDRLIDVAVEFLRLHESGELVDLDEYCAKYPEAERDSVRRECEQFMRVRGFLNYQGELAPGKTLSSYTISELIGQGGMGEVYRARDNKLDRDVAIKVLPPDLAREQVRVERFEREAKAIAALDHPNIVSIHSVEKDEGTPFLTMELVEGKTLAERIPKKGFSLEKFFDLAVSLVDAVSAAHESGIVHRDLKPTNVMVTKDGRVKVLDFGLAKLREGAAATGDRLNQPLTDVGAIVGTTAYMSPEQAEGTDVDHRSDIFNLGIVLYEMVTGQRPFKGDTRVAQMASIVNDTPVPVRELNPRVPHHLARVIRRSLEKDRERRFQSCKDLRNDLQDLRHEVSSGTTTLDDTGSVRSPAGGRPLWIAVSLAVASIGTLGIWILGGTSTRVEEWTVTIPDGWRLYGGGARFEHANTGGQRPSRTGMTMSRDGEWMVYSVTNGLTSQLYLQEPHDPYGAVPINGSEGASMPFLDPTATEVGFFRRDGTSVGSLWKVAVSGGEPQSLVEGIEDLTGAMWGDDGYIYYNSGNQGRVASSVTSGIFRVLATGGDPKRVTEIGPGDSRHSLPHVLPGGNALLYTIERDISDRWENSEVWVKPLLPPGKSKPLIVDGADGRYYRSSSGAEYLLFGRRGSLMAAGFDSRDLVVTSPQRTVRPAVMQSVYGWNTDLDHGALQVALADSALLYVRGGRYELPFTELYRVDRAGTKVRIGLPRDTYTRTRLSPIDDKLAIERGWEHPEILIHDLHNGTNQIIPLDGQQITPVWSPGGDWLAFWSEHESPGGIFKLPADDLRASPQRLTSSERRQEVADWSRLGILVLHAGNACLLNENGGEPRPLWDEEEIVVWPTFSPDGRWVVYCSQREGRPWEIYARSVHDPTPVTRGLEGRWPVFARDGKPRLSFTTSEGIMEVEFVATDSSFQTSTPTKLFDNEYNRAGPIRGMDVWRNGDFLFRGRPIHPQQTVTSMQFLRNLSRMLDELFK